MDENRQTRFGEFKAPLSLEKNREISSFEKKAKRQAEEKSVQKQD